jgi:hypothetical protein
MMEEHQFKFVDGYSEDPELSRTKGWVAGTLVLCDGRVFQLYFVTPVRLSQDAADEFERGRLFYAEPNMVLLADITTDGVLAAVQEIVATRYTDSLSAEPLQGELAKSP